MPDDRAETIEDVIAEMRKWPNGTAVNVHANRIEAALERERVAVLKVAEEMERVSSTESGRETIGVSLDWFPKWLKLLRGENE